MQPKIEIYTLGTLQVMRQGEPVQEKEWRTRQARQLLKILITERPRPVSTDRLIDNLWPDNPIKAAATTMRGAINALRNVLEPDRPTRTPSKYIHTQTPGYAFRPHPDIWLDVDAFETALDQAAAAEDPAQKQVLLEQARNLYRSDYLLGDPYADWAKVERQRLRERFFSGLLALAQLYAQAGAYDGAISLCRHILAQDEVRENAYQALMRYQAESGDSAAALLTYERCRTLLGEELGADPSPITQELHARILQGDIQVQPPAGLSAQAAPITSSQDAPLPQQMLLPPLDGEAPDVFVGREAEIQALNTALDQALHGRGSFVVLAGETGVGKTRLAYQMLQQAGELGATVISAACQRLERDLPYAPLADGIGQYLQLLPDSSLRRLPQSALAQLTQILPSIQDRLHDQAPPVDFLLAPEDIRQGVIDGLLTFLIRLAELRPLMLFLDDLHWADPDTLAVLGRLSRQIEKHPILLLGAYRQGDLVENAGLDALLYALRRTPACRVLPLERLSLNEVRLLVSRLVGSPEQQDDRLVHTLYRTTAGNALFVTEALKNLREHAQDAPNDAPAASAWLDPAHYLERLSQGERVQEIVRERIERLPEEAADVLRLAAVVGRDFSLELLERAAVMDSVAGLDMLLQRQFLLERLDERLEFVHQVVRQVAYDSLNPLARRRLHRRVAAALVALGKAEENPAEAAFHFGQAGAVGRLDYARYSILAGEMLLRTYSLHQAIAQLDSALQTLETLPTPPPDLVQRAFRGLGLAYENLLDPDGVTATYGRLRQWALETGDTELALTAHTRLTTLLGLVGQQSESNALMEELIGGQMDRPSPALADLLARRGLVFAQPTTPEQTDAPAQWPSFSPPGPVADNPEADLIAAMGPTYAALPLLIYGWLLQIQGQLPASEECLRAAVNLAEETGQRSLASLAYHQLSVTVMLRGNVAESQRLNEQSKTLNHQVHGTAAELAALWPRISSAYQALAFGHIQRATQRLQQTARFLEHRGSFRTHLNSTTIGLGLAAFMRERLGQAEALLRRGLADAENQYPYTYVMGLLGLARIAHRRDNLETSVGLLHRALAYAGQRSLVREYIACVQAITEIRPPGAPLERLRDESAALAHKLGAEPVNVFHSYDCRRRVQVVA